jgi:proteasome beta subunit
MQEINEKTLKTGTTTVGFVCKDGVILAADKRVSAGYRVVHKSFDKIHQISDNMVVTTAGLVSDAQLVVKLIRAELMLKKIRENRDSTVKEGANLLANIVYGNVRKMSMVQGIVGLQLGGKDPSGYTLVEIGIDGSLSFYEDYNSVGSGSDLALGVLEAGYVKNMSMDDGIKLVIKAINAAIQRDMPTGNGIDIFTITNAGVKKIMTKTVEYKVL